MSGELRCLQCPTRKFAAPGELWSHGAKTGHATIADGSWRPAPPKAPKPEKKWGRKAMDVSQADLDDEDDEED